jgi:hypothetical protein
VKNITKEIKHGIGEELMYVNSVENKSELPKLSSFSLLPKSSCQNIFQI